MATLMQKDVLIEFVAHVRGKNFYNKVGLQEEEKRKDSKFLSDKREYYYSTFPEEIDYQKELAELQALKAKYEVEA